MLGDASRIDGHSLDWSLERLTALYRYARDRSSEKGDNPNIACPLAPPVAAPRGGARIGSGATLAARVRVFVMRAIPIIAAQINEIRRRQRPPMNLLKAASTVSLLTLASRVSGLVREQLVAASFGASGFTDAYNVAFRIPNLLRRAPSREGWSCGHQS